MPRAARALASGKSHDSSFIDDSDEPQHMTAAQRKTVRDAMADLRTARVDVSELAGEYLSAAPQDARSLGFRRVEARVLAAAKQVACPAWPPGFVEQLRSDPSAAVAPASPHRGACGACGKTRWLSRELAWSSSSARPPVALGRVCAARALVAHSLYHAQATCEVALDEAPLIGLVRAQRAAREALTSLLDLSAEAAELGEADGRSADLVEACALRARAALGFAAA